MESEPGKGSTFFFTAKLRMGSSLDADAGGLSPHNGELLNLRALVVDDNATSRLILQQTLSTWGMQVVAVDSGAEAIRVMERSATERKPFDLLLSDYVPAEPAVPQNNAPQAQKLDVQEECGLSVRLKQHPQWAKAAIFMLTSDEYSRTAAQRRKLGLGAHLIKPVKQSELLEIICKLLVVHHDVPEKDTEEKNDVAAAAHADSLGRLKILLAEDNQVNQEVAVRMLERMGHAVTVVATGKDALEQIQRHRFDVVLMDVHMPEMDGFEATTAIRAWEKHQGGHTAIIATTANAMQGDREACLEAVMDGYLSKPVSRAALAVALHQARAGGPDEKA